MPKLTLNIDDSEKVKWAKKFAQRNNTSVSQLFEDYLTALMTFDQRSG